jgi:hypothetical protein
MTTAIYIIVALVLGFIVGGVWTYKIQADAEEKSKSIYADYHRDKDGRFMAVEMRKAWQWTCDNCGRDNYTIAVAPEMSPEDKERMLKKFDIDGIDDKSIHTYPDEVTCQYCKCKFETEGVSGDEWKFE